MPIDSRVCFFRWVAAAVLTTGCLLAALPAGAQGTVRTQNRDVTPGADALLSPDRGLEAVIDHREEMRRFIQNISAYARRSKPDFIVLAVNGLDLLTKPLEGDETKQFPARTYIRSIDGVIQEGVFYGIPTIDVATVPERRTPLLKALDVAKDNKLRVLTIDYAKATAAAGEAIRLSRAKGYLPFVSPERPLSRLPPYPGRPVSENARSVLSLADVRNFLFLPESAGFGRSDEYALALHGTNYDMLVVDIFHGRTALSKQAVETLKFKKLGSRRLVLARVNIGTAESDRYYWKAGWREGSPIWINAPYPANPDRYYVEFWRPEWQSIISGDAQSYLAGLMQQGFDGVVLDGLEAYRFFEGSTQTLDVTP